MVATGYVPIGYLSIKSTLFYKTVKWRYIMLRDGPSYKEGLGLDFLLGCGGPLFEPFYTGSLT